MLCSAEPRRKTKSAVRDTDPGRRYAAWFHELDAWTEYWDVYHPETRGRYYFGDGRGERGLLTQLLPRDGFPPAFRAWTQMATGHGSRAAFLEALREPAAAEAVQEVDALLARLFARHFGDAREAGVREQYLDATHRFAVNTLPPAGERDTRIAADDPRKSTAGRHRLEGDLMWFAWALQVEASCLLAPAGGAEAAMRRQLMLTGIAAGCAADFTWRGHRRTRAEYRPNAATARLLRQRALAWAGDFEAATREIHALYRIREWGTDE